MKTTPQHFISGHQMNLVHPPQMRLSDLEKMRSKLATAKPKALVEAEERKGDRLRWTGQGLAYGLSAAVILLLVGLICWAGISHQKPENRSARKGVQAVIPPSKALSIDEQTLYWAYALYDWSRFVQTFGVPKQALLNTQTAQNELNRLLPKASGQAQLTVMKYRNQAVRRL